MDQKALRELEYRCIQEEPPWCTAACPLHVDARAFAGHMAQERWADAWKVLRSAGICRCPAYWGVSAMPLAKHAASAARLVRPSVSVHWNSLV